MFFEIFQSLLETMQSFAWPITVLIIVQIFRAPVSNAIMRVNRISTPGFEISTDPKQQSEKGGKGSVQELLDSFDNSPALSEIENVIEKELQARNPTDEDAIKLLTKNLATTRMLSRFDQIDNLIFGGQLFLVKKLNEHGNVGLPEGAVHAYFENIKERFSTELSECSVDQYMQFLLANELIVKNHEAYQITSLGKEYLTWRVKYGKSEDKRL